MISHNWTEAPEEQNTWKALQLLNYIYSFNVHDDLMALNVQYLILCLSFDETTDEFAEKNTKMSIDSVIFELTSVPEETNLHHLSFVIIIMSSVFILATTSRVQIMLR